MHIAKDKVPVKIAAPGAAARQQTGFGDASGYGKISGEYFSLPAGMDIGALLQGLDSDLCDAPHWGYMLDGKVTVTYADGTQETISKNDIFYWPAGHTVKVEENAEVILFSPEHEHTRVLDHMLSRMQSQ